MILHIKGISTTAGIEFARDQTDLVTGLHGPIMVDKLHHFFWSLEIIGSYPRV